MLRCNVTLKNGKQCPQYAEKRGACNHHYEHIIRTEKSMANHKKSLCFLSLEYENGIPICATKKYKVKGNIGIEFYPNEGDSVYVLCVKLGDIASPLRNPYAKLNSNQDKGVIIGIYNDFGLVGHLIGKIKTQKFTTNDSINLGVELPWKGRLIKDIEIYSIKVHF